MHRTVAERLPAPLPRTALSPAHTESETERETDTETETETGPLSLTKELPRPIRPNDADGVNVDFKVARLLRTRTFQTCMRK